MDGPAYKLNVKLPDGVEFQAEGPEATVKSDFQLFIDAWRASPQKQSTATAPERKRRAMPIPIRPI